MNLKRLILERPPFMWASIKVRIISALYVMMMWFALLFLVLDYVKNGELSYILFTLNLFNSFQIWKHLSRYYLIEKVSK